jgi:hypothetical protein
LRTGAGNCAPNCADTGRVTDVVRPQEGDFERNPSPYPEGTS